MDKKDTFIGIGHPEVMLGADVGTANFHVLDIRLHNHLFDDEKCSYRWELRVTVLGIWLSLAWVRLYND